MKILHIDSNHPLLISKLAQVGFQNETAYHENRQEILQKIPHYQGLVLRSRIRIDPIFLDQAKQLKFIARVGSGLENIDTEHARHLGIQVLHAPEANRNAVGEHALGMLLALFTKLQPAHQSILNGKWNREQHRGIELDGKTIGLIGYGNTAKSFAQKLRGFDVKVLCYDIKSGVADTNATQVSMQQIFQEVDVLSLHVPLTARTHGLVNTEFIAKFVKPFWLINTARGACVEMEALVNALKSQKILGAGLDVLAYENSSFERLYVNPKTDSHLSALLGMQNVLLSPHIAGWTVESKEKLAKYIAEKIINLDILSAGF